MASAAVPKGALDNAIKFLDGAGTPDELPVTLRAGAFKWVDAQTSYEVLHDRQAISGVIPNQDQPGTWEFSAHVAELTNGSADNLLDWLRRQGSFNARVSTGTGAFARATTYYFSIEITGEVSNHDTGNTDNVTTLLLCLPDEIKWSDEAANVLEVKGRFYGGYTVTGTS